MKRLHAGCAWFLALGTPLLLALSHVTRLRFAHGGLDSLPFTGVVLAEGELRIGRMMHLEQPLKKSAIASGGRWKTLWSRYDTPRAYFGPDCVAVLERTGCLGIGLSYDDLFISSAFRPPQDRVWRFDLSFRMYRGPFWPFILLTTVYPLRACRRVIRKRFRKSRGLCIPCGYNLTGNTSGICPECGTAVLGPPADSASPAR